MVATDDLWEVRVVFAGNIFRLLGWMEGMDELVPPRAPSDAQVPWAYSGLIRQLFSWTFRFNPVYIPVSCRPTPFKLHRSYWL